MTPTNEAGHGLPELPESVWLSDVPVGTPLYTADHVQQYAKDYAAALALSRGVPADMVLVPRKLTSDMADAYMRLFTGTERFSAERMWDGLLAAAPAAACAQGEVPKGWTPDDLVICREAVECLIERSKAYIDEWGNSASRKDLCSAERGTIMLGERLLDLIDNTRFTTLQPAAADGGVRELPSVAAFASAMWRDWMTNEQADKLGAELHAWLSAHFATALSSHRQAGGESIRSLHARFMSDTSGLSEEWQDWRNDFARDIRALVEKGAGNG